MRFWLSASRSCLNKFEIGNATRISKPNARFSFFGALTFLLAAYAAPSGYMGTEIGRAHAAYFEAAPSPLAQRDAATEALERLLLVEVWAEQCITTVHREDELAAEDSFAHLDPYDERTKRFLVLAMARDICLARQEPVTCEDAPAAALNVFLYAKMLSRNPIISARSNYLLDCIRDRRTEGPIDFRKTWRSLSPLDFILAGNGLGPVEVRSEAEKVTYASSRGSVPALEFWRSRCPRLSRRSQLLSVTSADLIVCADFKLRLEKRELDEATQKTLMKEGIIIK